MRVKPKRCEFISDRDTAGTYVVRLRWTSWGARKAVGTGTFKGNMGHTAKIRVVLTRPDRCGVGSQPFFRRISMAFDDAKPLRGRLFGPCD